MLRLPTDLDFPLRENKREKSRDGKKSERERQRERRPLPQFVVSEKRKEE